MALKSKLLVGTVLLLVFLAVLFWIRPWSNKADTATQLYGNVDVRELQLAFRTGGRLQSMNVEEGDLVAAGDSLASLDSGPAEDKVKIADAELAHAEAQLASIRAGSRPQEIAQARAAIRDAQAAFDDAQRTAKRQAQLLETQSTSRTLLESAQTLQESAAARLVSAKEALALLVAGARPQDIKAAEALVAVVQAQRDQAARTLSDTVLAAPTAGIIRTRIHEPGSMLTIGQSVYTLALNDQLYVRAYAEEPMLSSIAPGTQVSIHTDSGGRYLGQIGFISPTAEFTPKTVQTPELRTSLVYRLRILVKDADQGLRQGMPVTIVLPDVMP